MSQVSEIADPVQELGANFDVGEIPADLKDEAEEWHEKLVETAIEVDDAAMEAFFEGEVSGQDAPHSSFSQKFVCIPCQRSLCEATRHACASLLLPC